MNYRHGWFACASLMALAAAGKADIFRWDNGQVIPGTEGIVPAPEVQLNGRELEFARLADKNLTGANFSSANLTNAFMANVTLTSANLTGANLTDSWLLRAMLANANLMGANLTGANLEGSILVSANLQGAVVIGADFRVTTSRGLTKEQLYSTASYQAKDLHGIKLGAFGDFPSPAYLAVSDLTDWDFSGQNLTGADFSSATLASASLTDAVVTGASFGDTSSHGFTKEQLYSTASYKAKNLQGICLRANDLAGWDFGGQIVTGADFGRTVHRGFTKEQLYSTASHQTKELQGIKFYGDDLGGWDFTGQDLTGASLIFAGLTGTDFTDAVINDVFFAAPTLNGFTKEQLYSTASYKAKNLRGISFWGASTYFFIADGSNLTGWDFSGQDLAGAALDESTLTSANLSGANLTGVNFHGSKLTNADLTRADARGAVDLNLNGAITTNLIRPDGRIVALNLTAGEKLVAYAGVPTPVRVAGAFAINPLATFDLTNNAAIVDYAGTSSAATVREQIVLGRGGAGLGGKWNGTGITSSMAAAANLEQADSRSLGYADNATLPLGPYTAFHSLPVDESSILIAFTRNGDANLDGVVNDDDVTIVGATYAPGVPQPSWALGDFDYNGFVDDDDVTLLNAFYNPSAAPLNSPALPGVGGGLHSDMAAVPEPSTAVLAVLILVLAGAISVVTRGRRRLALVGAAAMLTASPAARGDIFRWDTGAVIPGTEGIVPGPGVRLDGRELEFANFYFTNLTEANFALANLTDARFDLATLTNANLTGAVVAGADFGGTTSLGLSKEQLYSTASYQDKSLRGIGLGMFYFGTWGGSSNDLTGWDFTGQDLTDANLTSATMIGTDLTGAVVTGACFNNIWTEVAAIITKEQLYSTASYQAKHLQRIELIGNDMTGWDFTGQDLTGADFHAAKLTNARLTGANLTGARMEDATVTIADLRGANLTGANCFRANLTNSNLTNAVLSGVNLSKADTRGAIGLNLAGAMTTNLIRPDGVINHLNLVQENLIAFARVPIPVKFDSGFSITNGAQFDLTDSAAIVDYAATSPATKVRAHILSGRGGPGLGGAWTGTGITSSTAAATNEAQPDSRSLGYADNTTLPLGRYTTFHGASVDSTSVLIAYTRTGDANLDGVVNDDDVTIVGAHYSRGVPNANWALGDFDYNGFVDDDDVTLLGAFYDPSAAPLGSPPAEPGARALAGATAGVAAIPEPTTVSLVLSNLSVTATAMALTWWRRRRHGGLRPG